MADAATVSSNTADPDLTNNTATFGQLIGPVADLTIAKAALQSDGTTPLPVTNPLDLSPTHSSTRSPSPTTARTMPRP